MDVVIEMRPRIQVCNVFIITRKCINDNRVVKINVQSSSIQMEITSDTTKRYQNISLEGYKLVPNSLSALKVQANSITFRLQTEPPSNITGSFATEILRYRDMKQKFIDFVPAIVPKQLCQISCKCCGHSISAGVVNFRRVLPLPSATWEDGDWFCHRHSDVPASERSSIATQLQNMDCLYGMCFILVPSSMLCLTSDQIARCSRCLAWLGTLQKGKVKLWNCNIVCGGSEPITALQDFESVVSAAIHDSVGMLCRLLVETRVLEQETQYLLLWVMDKDLNLLINVDNDCLEVNEECKLKSVQAVKVLYLHQLESTSMVKQWQSDVNVQSIDVAKQMFVAGLEHLIKATQFIPPHGRSTNNFYVSYLGLGIP